MWMSVNKIGNFGLLVTSSMYRPISDAGTGQPAGRATQWHHWKPNWIKPASTSFLRCFWSRKSGHSGGHLWSCCCFWENSNFLKLQTYCVRSAEANMLTQSNGNTHKMLPFCVRIFICNLRDFWILNLKLHRESIKYINEYFKEVSMNKLTHLVSPNSV